MNWAPVSIQNVLNSKEGSVTLQDLREMASSQISLTMLSAYLNLAESHQKRTTSPRGLEETPIVHALDLQMVDTTLPNLEGPIQNSTLQDLMGLKISCTLLISQAMFTILIRM